jgi:hypothetical protein
MPIDLTRRRLLRGSAAALGAATLGAGGLGLPAKAASGADLKFVFVVANGGWDPTRAFAPEFGNGNVDMEGQAGTSQAGEIPFVDHPDRPNVRAFFTQNHTRMLVLNGVQVRSIAHDICTTIALTGTTSTTAPDWATLIAVAESETHTLPHLVLSGPSYAGPYGPYVARTGESSQLEGLLNGDLLMWSDTPVTQIPGAMQGAVDIYLRKRAAAFEGGLQSAQARELAAAHTLALDRAVDLKNHRYVMDFSSGSTLGDQCAVAVDALSVGLSRCVTMAFPGKNQRPGFDTHVTNDQDQLPLWEELFDGLSQLMAMLQTSPGRSMATLADETVVVVLSEMGRTPQLNDKHGKDHWPYTSAMILGPGITGNRVIGAYDEAYYGEYVDLGSGESHAKGSVLSIDAVGGGLLALAGIDPGEHVAGGLMLGGMLL